MHSHLTYKLLNLHTNRSVQQNILPITSHILRMNSPTFDPVILWKSYRVQTFDKLSCGKDMWAVALDSDGWKDVDN